MMMSNIRRYKDLKPQISKSAYVDDSAVIIGDVILRDLVSIWPTVVLRGDQGKIVIGDETNIQDGTIAHATGGLSTVSIGKRCTIGHRALLHGCTVEDDCLIGMGAILLDNCHISSWSIVGAGAVVTANTKVPEGSLVLGCPAKVVKVLSQTERETWIRHGHAEYLKLKQDYQNE
jgi:gamma-carbonic anhydrase